MRFLKKSGQIFQIHRINLPKKFDKAGQNRHFGKPCFFFLKEISFCFKKNLTTFLSSTKKNFDEFFFLEGRIQPIIILKRRFFKNGTFRYSHFNTQNHFKPPCFSSLMNFFHVAKSNSRENFFPLRILKLKRYFPEYLTA